MTCSPARNPGAETAYGEQRRWRPWQARGLCLALLAGGAALAIGLDWLPMLAELPEQAMASRSARWTILAIYVAVLAVPFVPGAEIGLALMVAFGAMMALPVYVATIAALSIAFVAGRLLSRCGLSQPFGGEGQASDALAGLSSELRTPGWLQPPMRFRWLAVIVLINTPGNTVIGGGGGIAMAAGYSRTFTYPAFLVCVALAVAPVPAAVLIAEHLGIGDTLARWAQGLNETSPAAVAND